MQKEIETLKQGNKIELEKLKHKNKLEELEKILEIAKTAPNIRLDVE